jgi:hypothetical protein
MLNRTWVPSLAGFLSLSLPVPCSTVDSRWVPLTCLLAFGFLTSPLLYTRQDVSTPLWSSTIETILTSSSTGQPLLLKSFTVPTSPPVTIMDLWAANYVFPFIRFDPDSLPTHSDCHEVTYDDWSTYLCLLTAWLIRLLMLCHAYWYYQAWVSILTVRLVILLTSLTDPLAMTHAPMGCTYI